MAEPAFVRASSDLGPADLVDAIVANLGRVVHAPQEALRRVVLCLVAGSAVALMVAYGLIAYRIPDVQIRLDRLGDNFYYLGFIFTLASMSAALIQLRAEPNIEAILGSFGIALITTIVGVAGRVLFTQMRTNNIYLSSTNRDEKKDTDILFARLVRFAHFSQGR